MTDQLYHLSNIRDLLIEGFDDRDLRRLCYDVPDFRPVYERLAQNTGKADIVDQLLEHAEKNLQIDTLLALAKERNPARYEHHGPYYYDDPTDTLQKQVSDLARRLSAVTSRASLNSEQQVQIAVHWKELGGKDSLRGFDLCAADLRFAKLGGADLRQARLDRARLNLADLSGADLRGADLRGADLDGADLSGADLRLANLAGARLHGTRVDGATQMDAKWRLVWEIANQETAGRNLNGADLAGACLSATTLWGADLRGADLGGADLSGADLRKANLSEASLVGANLAGAGLSGAELYGTDLEEADLGGADLSGADLYRANVTAGQLDAAGSLAGATLPDGSKFG